MQKLKPVVAKYCLTILASTVRNHVVTAISVRPAEHFDATEQAQKALSCVYRVNQSFGMGYVVEVLRGMQNIRIRENGP